MTQPLKPLQPERVAFKVSSSPNTVECNIQEWNAERCKLSRAVARFAGRNDVRMARVHSKHWDAKILFSDEQVQLVYHVECFVFCTVYNFRNFPLGNEHKTKTN